MRLFRLTIFTIFQRKSWIIGLFMVAALPFILPQLSSSTENPTLLKPAIAQTTWAMAWLASVFWGFFTAARHGESNARSGLGEYFQTTGMSATRQMMEMWLAVFCYVAPLGLIAAGISILAASPALPDERAMWLTTNLQYAVLFILTIAPLLALSLSIASRFGGISGFLSSAFIAFYGLYGVGYMKMLLQLEENRVLQWLWTASPHYHFADPTERLRYKLGAIDPAKFPLFLAYFGGIFLVWFAFSRLFFRSRVAA